MDKKLGQFFKYCALLFAIIGLAACQSAQANKPMQPQGTAPSIQIPSNFNTNMLDVIDEGRRVRIYTQMNHIGGPQNNQLLFPARVGKQLGLTNTQINRRFMDSLLAVKRFEVFDDSYTGIQDQGRQQWGPDDADIVVDCMVVDARQEVLDIQPYRKIRTQVKMSVHMVDRNTGKNLFDSDVSIMGIWGDVQGQGTLLSPDVSLKSQSVQTSLGGDYEKALSKALDQVVERIDHLLRPVGRVTFVSGRSISMFGGVQHGFQGGDDVVVIRVHRRDVNGYQRIVGLQPIACAHCSGVESDLSQCVVTGVEPGEHPADGDYAILTDNSANKPR